MNCLLEVFFYFGKVVESFKISKSVAFLGSGIDFGKSHEIMYIFEEITLSFKSNELNLHYKIHIYKLKGSITRC